VLHAFKEHLKSLASDPKDPFLFKVRQRVGKRAAVLLEKRLRRLVAITPDVVERVYALWHQFGKDLPARKVGGYLLTYLYHPKDFLNEEEHGLFGYLDDAYFTALVYEFVLERLQETGNQLTAQDKRFLKEISNMKDSARIVIPNEAEKIELMFKEIQENEQSVTFQNAFRN